MTSFFSVIAMGRGEASAFTQTQVWRVTTLTGPPPDEAAILYKEKALEYTSKPPKANLLG